MNLNLQRLNESEGVLPKHICDLILQYVSDYISDEIIDTVSKIKKCNEIGRECLVTDINYLRSIIEGLIQKHLECFDEVEAYLKAYFMPREELLSFIKHNVLVYSYN